jgi:hypothetical protein
MNDVIAAVAQELGLHDIECVALGDFSAAKDEAGARAAMTALKRAKPHLFREEPKPISAKEMDGPARAAWLVEYQRRLLRDEDKRQIEKTIERLKGTK